MSPELINFFQHLGIAIIDSLWQMGVIWLAITTLLKLFKSITARSASIISFVGLAAGFILFVTNLVGGSPHAYYGSFINFYLSAGGHYLGLIYLLVLVYPLSRFIFGFKGVGRLKKIGNEKLPPQLRIYARRMAEYLNIRRDIKIFATSFVQSPLTVGFLKPVILLPIAVVNNLTIRQLEAIILHELAHIKSNDYLFNIITRFFEAIMYFNPFAKLLAKMQRLEREKLADGWVTRFEYDGFMYSSALLALAKAAAKPNAFAVNAVKGKGQLQQRIEFILGRKERAFPDFRTMLFSLVVIMLSFFASLPQRSALQNNLSSLPVSYVAYPDGDMPPFVAATDNEPVITVVSQKTPGHAVLIIKASNKPGAKTNQRRSAEPLSSADPMPLASAGGSFSFIENRADDIPQLQADDEKRVQEAVLSAKKIVADITWKQIESSLAETMTSDKKQILETQFKAMIGRADWKSLEDQLHLKYNALDWKSAQRQINTALASIKFDSIYNRYRAVYENSKTTGNATAQQTTQAAKVKALVEKMDSLRSRTSIEL